jgi:hypothetical protein
MTPFTLLAMVGLPVSQHMTRRPGFPGHTLPSASEGRNECQHIHNPTMERNQ